MAWGSPGPILAAHFSGLTADLHTASKWFLARRVIQSNAALMRRVAGMSLAQHQAMLGCHQRRTLHCYRS